MKKKIVISILAALASLACFTACDNLGGLFGKPNGTSTESSSPSGVAEYDAASVAAVLDAKYTTDLKDGRTDYEVINSYIDTNDLSYTITWTVSDPNVATIKNRPDYTRIIINKLLTQNTNYVLTGTVTAADGSTATAIFPLVAHAVPSQVLSKITAAPQKNVAYKLFVYQTANGKELYINGKMKNTYYFDTVNDSAKAIDVYAIAVNDGGFNLKTSIDGADKYINVVKSGSHINAKYEDAASSVWVFDESYGTIVTEVEGTKYYLGADGTYNTVEPQSKRDDGYYMGYLTTITDRASISNEERVSQTKNELKFAGGYVGNASMELAPLGDTYPETSISWAVSGEGATINDGLLTLTAGNASSLVTVTATLTSGSVTDTKVFSVYLTPNVTAEILNSAFAMESGKKFGNNATLTGVITEITAPYDGEYENVSVMMQVGDKEIECYRMKGVGADEIKKGDTITVTGILSKYQDSVQFDYGCELDSFVAGPELPEEPKYDTPAADATITIAHANAYGATFAHNKYSTDKYYVVGEIASAPAGDYGNTSIKDADGNVLNIYGMYDATGDVRYDAMSVKPKVGDTVKIYGVLGTYNGTVQMKNAWVVELNGTAQKPSTPETPETPANFVIPEEDVAYKFYLVNNNNYNFLTGEKSGDYLATTTDSATAKDFYVEAVDEDSFKIYYLNGTEKVYIAAEGYVDSNGKNKAHAIYNAEGATFSYGKTDLYDGYWYTTVGEEDFAIGTYSTYTTMSLSYTSYYENAGQLPALFVKADKVAELPTLGGTTETPDEDDNAPEATVEGTLYTFKDYTAGVQYALNEVHTLDDVITVTTNDAHFAAQLRLYDFDNNYGTHHSTAVIKSTKVIDAVKLNAGYKNATLNVYGSTDGETWTLLREITTTEAYADYSIVIEDSAYTYVKLEAVGAQVRVQNMTIDFAE